ncbi:MAG: hypothetical protein KC996_08085 [Phycisphaerales bacterium]|nr:hypothetical protein [Phycisphaerales bacterium]
MPAVSSPRTECIARLADELCYASKPTLVRHLARIDGLAPNIEQDGLYPEDWIIFRVTGYRKEINDPALIPGSALLGDLSALAERLSEAASLTKEDIGPNAHSVHSLMERWGVSRKTIDRYRRLGLIARRIDGGKGVRTLAFLPDAVDWFEQCNSERLGRAAKFSRSNNQEIQRIERWARRYRDRLGWSRSRTASRIAERTGRCHEGVRRILLRLDEHRETPIFPEPGPPSDREQLFALRAYNRCIPTAAIARRTNRNTPAVRRAINAARYDVLLDCAPEPPHTTSPIPDESALETEPMRSGLAVEPCTDLSALIRHMRIKQPTVVYEEHTRATGYRVLMTRASALLASLEPTRLSSVKLDELETSLRWASRVKAALLSTQLPAVLTTIENHIGGPIDSLQPQRAASILLESIRVAASALERYDPTHGGRLAAPVGLALTRFATRLPDAVAPIAEGRATRRITPGFEIPDWTRSVALWQRYLDPDPRIEANLAHLDERDQTVLTQRFGFAGTPPHTIDHLATVLDLPRVQAARALRRVYRRGLLAARKESRYRTQ